MRLIDPDSPSSQRAGKVLATTGAHPHIVTAQCPVGCLDGLIPAHAIRALTARLPARQDQPTLADLVTAYHRRTLLQIKGIGLVGIAAIGRQLSAAGLIEDTGQEKE